MEVLQKCGFCPSFLEWIEDISKNQESCLINAGITTSYFKLQKGARQGYTICAYLFIVALEILFYLIKNNKKIEALNIGDYSVLYSAWVDVNNFILRNVSSVIEIVSMIGYFSNCLGLKSNIFKYKIACITGTRSCGRLRFKICWLDIRCSQNTRGSLLIQQRKSE